MKNKKEEPLRVTVEFLDEDLAKLFLKRCAVKERSQAGEIRYVLRQYYQDLEDRIAFEEFKRQRRAQSSGIPHVPGSDAPEIEQRSA